MIILLKSAIRLGESMMINMSSSSMSTKNPLGTGWSFCKKVVYLDSQAVGQGCCPWPVTLLPFSRLPFWQQFVKLFVTHHCHIYSLQPTNFATSIAHVPFCD
jgi:hypothetical protein